MEAKQLQALPSLPPDPPKLPAFLHGLGGKLSVKSAQEEVRIAARHNIQMLNHTSLGTSGPQGSIPAAPFSST